MITIHEARKIITQNPARPVATHVGVHRAREAETVTAAIAACPSFSVRLPSPEGRPATDLPRSSGKSSA